VKVAVIIVLGKAYRAKLGLAKPFLNGYQFKYQFF
jgi:hypothetical protein